MDVQDEDLLVGMVAAGIAIQELEHGIDMDVTAHAATLSRRTKQLRNRVRKLVPPQPRYASWRAPPRWHRQEAVPQRAAH